MSGTTDFVGVRVFPNLTATTAKIDTRDSTVIGAALPSPLADNTRYPINELARISLDDAEAIEDLGAGHVQDMVNQIAAGGIVTDIAFVRTQHSVLTDPTEKLEAEINSIVGSAGSKTGAWALLDAKDELGLEPGLLIAPGFTSQRIDDAANAVATTLSTIAGKIIDAIVIADAPSTSREDAEEWAEDFATALNVVGMFPNCIMNLGAGNVTRPLSASVAAQIVRNDKANGNPYKAFWNKRLEGVLGLNKTVNYIDGEITSDANWLNQRGLGTVIEKNLLWSPFTTATDPTTVAWRSIKKIRTRRAIEKAVVRPLRLYMSQDLTPHMATLVYQSLDEFLGDLVTLGALVDYEIIWSKAMNPRSLLEAGAMRVKARFAETPDLVDLQIYDEPMPEAFDVLEAAIASALTQLGSSNIRVTA